MIGGGILLFVIGAIIYFALNVNIAGIEEGTLGLILMAAGAVIAILGLLAAPFRLWAERRRTTVGISMVNVVPTPILLSQRILPSWASTMPFTMASPKPVPTAEAERWLSAW